jgi:hypothetical protein
VGKQNVIYRFHNPNSTRASVDFILRVFMEVNMAKVERALREAAYAEQDNVTGEMDTYQGHSA